MGCACNRVHLNWNGDILYGIVLLERCCVGQSLRRGLLGCVSGMPCGTVSSQVLCKCQRESR
jgi:hypothetical protein